MSKFCGNYGTQITTKNIVNGLLLVILCFALSSCSIDSTTEINTSRNDPDVSENSSEETFTYDIESENNRTATITGYTGNSEKISIPESIDGYKIVKISSLPNCGMVEKITIPSSVVEIDNRAFENTGYYADKENWVDGALYLDDYLIAVDSNITMCNVKEGTKYIANCAFEDCLNLKTVTLPDSVISIGSYAFWKTDLENITLGNGLKRIGDSAFEDCQNLMSIELPQSVERLGASVFSGTQILDFSLDCIYIGKCLVWVNRDSEGEFKVQDGTSVIADRAFENCNDITDIVIPNSVKSIGNYAFVLCDSLYTLQLGSNVSYIGSYAFLECKNLMSIILPATISYLGDGFCCGCDKLTTISFTGENALFVSEQSGLYSKDKKTLICVPNNVEGIYNVDDHVEHICYYAFENCENITEIVLPSRLTYIKPETFRHCDKLKSITVNDNNKNYSSENGVLFNKGKTLLVVAPKSELNTYSIPSSVIQIGEYAFADSKLTNISIPSSVTQIGKCAFADSELTNISIPDSVERIDDGAFEHCEYLERVTLSDSINHIGEEAFAYCEKIQHINIPANLKIIENAFANLPSITAIKIPGTVETIGTGAFYSCRSLESVEIQSGVKHIGFVAFKECDSLKTVKIPASVSDIDASAFKECKSLTDIYFEGSEMQWESYGIVDIGGINIHYNAQ